MSRWSMPIRACTTSTTGTSTRPTIRPASPHAHRHEPLKHRHPHVPDMHHVHKR